jgi:hypothetical protein
MNALTKFQAGPIMSSYLRINFGKEFAEAALSSSLCIGDVQQLMAHGCTFQISSKQTACYVLNNRFFISSKGDVLGRLCAISHEKFRLIDQRGSVLNPVTMGRDEFISFALDIETAAEEHTLKVLDQMIAAGFKMAPQPEVRIDRLSLYSAWKKRGDDMLRFLIGQTHVADTKKTFVEYMGQWWDETSKSVRVAS